MSAKLRYVGAAAALGLLWYFALLVPRATREFLFGIPRGIVVVCLISVALALLFRRWIVGTRSLHGNVMLSLLLPLFGTLFYSIVLVSFRHLRGATEPPALQTLLMESAMYSVWGVVLVVTRAFYIIVPLGMMSQLLLKKVGLGGQTSADVTFHRLVIGALIVSALCIPGMTWLDRTRTVTHEMTWEYGPSSVEHPGTQHVILRFVKYPRHFIAIFSSDLGQYLESLPKRRVAVTFAVTYDLGRVRGFRELKIGDLEKWDSQSGYAGTQGSGEDSPWDAASRR